MYRFLESKYLIILSLCLSGCDCLLSHKGYVLDSNTEHPIENATVKFNNRIYKTNSHGFFEFNYVTGKCPDGKFEITEENHKKEILIIEQEKGEMVYKIIENNNGVQKMNSQNFKVKNDTLYFYLSKIEAEGLSGSN